MAEGGTATFTIVADQPLVETTSVNYQISGSAQAGDDFDALTGTVVMPAGSTSVAVPIRTLDDDVLFLPERHGRGRLAGPGRHGRRSTTASSCSRAAPCSRSPSRRSP